MGGVDGVEVRGDGAELGPGVRRGGGQGGGIVAEVEVDGVVDARPGCCHAQVVQLAAGERGVLGALGCAGQGGVGGVLETQPDLDPGGEECVLLGEGEVFVNVLEAGFPVPPDVAADGGDPGGLQQWHGGAQDRVVNEHVVPPGDGWDGPYWSRRWRGAWCTWCSSRT